MTEVGLTKNQILSELTRSPHGKLQEYVPLGLRAAGQDPEFYAHLIAWNRVKSQIRDSKVALPVISMKVQDFPEEFVQNSLAHLALLGPREVEKALRFAFEIRIPGHTRRLIRVVRQYLDQIEKIWPKWEAMTVQDRRTFANLYALTHKARPDKLADILFYQNNGPAAHPAGTKFETVGQLSKMSAMEAAGAILVQNIPFLIAQGALGKKITDSDLVLALIKQMTPTQLITNVKMLERLGVKTNPALRGAFDAAFEKASKSTRNVLKTTRAAETIQDVDLKQKLQGLQERQLSKLGGVEGNWLVLGDKSGSMTQAIESAKLVAATLAKLVKGQVTLIFFNTVADRVFDATGKTYDQIKADTKWVQADGGTSIGSGLQYCIDRKVEVDGIAIVSDGGENTAPYFSAVYDRYSAMIGKEVPVYLYQTSGDQPHLIRFMEQAQHDLQVFDIQSGVDFYSLPDLVQTMRTQRYGLIEEIMDFKLLTLADVFETQTEPVAQAV
jgi:hypothetical protein